MQFTEEPIEEEAGGDDAASEPDQTGAAVEVPVPPRGGAPKKPADEPELAGSGPLIAAHRPEAPTLRSDDEPSSASDTLHAQPAAESSSTAEPSSPPPVRSHAATRLVSHACLLHPAAMYVLHCLYIASLTGGAEEDAQGAAL